MSTSLGSSVPGFSLRSTEPSALTDASNRLSGGSGRQGSRRVAQQRVTEIHRLGRRERHIGPRLGKATTGREEQGIVTQETNPLRR